MRDYLKLLNFVKVYKWIFVTAIVVMFFSTLFEGTQLSLIIPIMDRILTNKQIIITDSLPDFIRNCVDFLNNTDRWVLFRWLPIVVIIMIFCKQALIYTHQLLMSSISQKVVRDIRFNLYNKIQNTSLDYFSKRRTGELISRITNDVLLVENAVSYATTDLFKQSFLIITYLGIAIAINPKGTLIIVLLFPVIGIPITLIGKRLRKIAKLYQEKLADISTHLIETISGIFLVKASNTENYEVDKFRKDNEILYKFKMSEIKRMILLGPITEIFGVVCGMVVFVVIGKPVMLGEMSTGVFFLFFGSVLQIISPVKKLGNVNAIIQKALSANKRIYDVLDYESVVTEVTNPKDIGIIKEEISINCKEFHYGNKEETILKDIKLSIKKGEMVAIVGPTGMGKTTLINLLPRFYDPVQGEIKIDGIDLKDVSFSSLRGQMGIVTQDTILFNDTVRNNIAYGQINATEENIQFSAKQAFVHDFIEKMPNKYDTFIGDRGFRLSGGQKQRIAIARAILKNAPILILDEATSALDTESERYVQGALDKLMTGRTVIVVAHRLSTIQKADKIVVIDKGMIVSVGQHNDLLKTCQLYKRLYTS